jgi:hypothetical protein
VSREFKRDREAAKSSIGTFLVPHKTDQRKMFP